MRPVRLPIQERPNKAQARSPNAESPKVPLRENSSLSEEQPESLPEAGLNQQQPAKRTRNRVPPPQRERIMHKFVAGKGISEISREENRNRETVARIVHSDEMQEHVRRAREEFYGLTGIALRTLRHALEKERNGTLAYKVLADSGVIPSSFERTHNLVSKGPEGESQIGRIISQLLVGVVVKGREWGMDVRPVEEELARAGGQV